LRFQNLLGRTYRELESLNDFILVWLIVITVVVSVVFIYRSTQERRLIAVESETLEKVWTFIPILILIRIAAPRIHLLCVQDALCLSPSSRVKIIRNQWNWQREQVDSVDHLLDSEQLFSRGSFESPILSEIGSVRVVLRRTDVLHSLGVPRLGVKLDSVPGRLNTTTSDITRLGLFLGSCYELCGRGHRVIPISWLVI
jgi:heme/copper-type cytochrome/quinol oxidase subunit 2